MMMEVMMIMRMMMEVMMIIKMIMEKAGYGLVMMMMMRNYKQDQNVCDI